MIREFVKEFFDRKEELEEAFRAKHPADYKEIVTRVVKILAEAKEDYASPDPKRITEIDHGSYQGTLVYVIAEEGYQPSMYWYVKVGYGSCSGCDTLEGIRMYDDDPPTDKQVQQYMTLALHIVQGLKRMGSEEWFKNQYPEPPEIPARPTQENGK